MHPVFDIDAVILLATTLSSKRRPAELAEIVAAADMIQGMVPFVDKLGGAIERLSAAGLIAAGDSGFTLTPAALAIMATQPKRASTEDLLAAIKHELAELTSVDACAPVVLTQAELGAAIRAHKDSVRTPAKNLAMPKTRPDRHFKVEGRWRRAPGTRKPKP